jgi:hypothetical protein
LRRKALFQNQWIRSSDGTWTELLDARFSHDATGERDRLDRFMGTEAGGFFLSHGGFVPGHTARGKSFRREPHSQPPEIQLPEAGNCRGTACAEPARVVGDKPS